MIARAIFALWLSACAAGTTAAAPPEFRSTTEAATILYDAPSTRARKVFIVGRGYPLEVIVTLEGWLKVRDAQGELSWVESRAVANRRMAIVRARLADIRESPDDAAKVAFQAAQSVLLQVIELGHDGWVRVQHADGSAGFVRANQLWGV